MEKKVFNHENLLYVVEIDLHWLFLKKDQVETAVCETLMALIRPRGQDLGWKQSSRMKFRGRFFDSAYVFHYALLGVGLKKSKKFAGPTFDPNAGPGLKVPGSGSCWLEARVKITRPHGCLIWRLLSNTVLGDVKFPCLE